MGEACVGVRIARAARLHGGGGGGGRLRDLEFEESRGCQISSAPDRVSAITGLHWQVVVFNKGGFLDLISSCCEGQKTLSLCTVAFLFERQDASTHIP